MIDAHVHVGVAKYGPVEQYLETMHEHGLERAVLVQYLGNFDNDYLRACLEAHPGRFAAVGAMDVTAADAPRRVEGLVRAGFRGVRLAAATRSPGSDPDAVWRAIADGGLVASVTGPFDDVVSPSLLRIVDALPQAHFRFEHLGWLRYADDPLPHEGFRRFLELAERPNTSTTWSGFFLNSAWPHPYPDAEPFLRMSLAAFTPHRIMWSGDWNRPGLDQADYDLAIQHVLQCMPFLDDEARAWILGRSAAAIFELGGAP